MYSGLNEADYCGLGVGLMSEVDLSVVVVSWNVSALVVACLESVLAAARDMTIEVIIVDNNSTDSTVEQVRARFPQVRLIANRHNAGFAAANNQALGICCGRNILLLNPDTIVLENSLTRMVTFADANSSVGLLGPRLQTPSGHIQEYCARSFPTPIDWFWYYSLVGQVFHRSRVLGKLYLSYWNHETSRPVDALAGAAMLIPRRTLDEVGFLDENAPMYFEDLDYCFRVRRAGRTVYYLAEATVIHYGGQSSLLVPVETKILILDAYVFFLRRYGRRLDPGFFRLAVVAASLVRLPVLGMVKACASIRRFESPKVGRISLRSEVVALFWGLGLMRGPRIERMHV
jgi:GT2 family glycosyltransferase